MGGGPDRRYSRNDDRQDTAPVWDREGEVFIAGAAEYQGRHRQEYAGRHQR